MEEESEFLKCLAEIGPDPPKMRDTCERCRYFTFLSSFFDVLKWSMYKGMRRLFFTSHIVYLSDNTQVLVLHVHYSDFDNIAT